MVLRRAINKAERVVEGALRAATNTVNRGITRLKHGGRRRRVGRRRRRFWSFNFFLTLFSTNFYF